MKRTLMLTVAALCAALCRPLAAADAAADAAKESKAGAEAAKLAETRAQRMVKGAVNLFEQKEDERAIGMLEAVQRMYPTSQARFSASLELGRRYIEKRVFDKALAELRKAEKAESSELRAESMLLQGQLHLAKGESGESVMVLRRLTHDYPTSAFANDAYFMIGQIHFEAGRWARAAEAFQMVGTAVPESASSNQTVLVEAGQRVFAHVRDKDLAVLASLGEKSFVRFKSRSGDSEKAELVAFGRGDGDFIASVRTSEEASKPDDGVLTVQGSEAVEVVYVDANNEKGDADSQVNADAEVVSSAVLSFLDGAERQRIRGLFVDQPTFVHLRDCDLDVTPGPDKATIVVKAQYRERPEPAPGETEAPPPAPDAPWLTRSEATMTLVETDGRSGLFKGRLVARLMPEGTNEPPAKLPAGEIYILPEDRVVAEYEDMKHLEGAKPVMRSVSAVALVGGSTEPQSIVSHSNEANVQAKKLLLEAQLLCKWGTIFKDVGLQENAKSKADEGLRRIADILELSRRHTLERGIIEETYEARWNLLLVNGDLRGAIATCRALVKLYPDTLIADRAFMQIATAHMQTKTKESLHAAIDVLNAIISLPNSQLKAEAQFRIGEARERLNDGLPPGKADFSAAIMAYKRCAEMYPSSSYAGESYKRIVDYDLSIKNYTAATEILERVFEDYPDAPWLDEMLLKWGVVMYRLGNRQGARQKFQRVIEEYPGGKSAKTAKSFLDRLGADDDE